jgi:MFS family permease
VRRRILEAGRRTFRSISVRNYRLYFTGQVISVSGTWMQTVAQAYLILFPLHGTGIDVAVATSLQFVPMLLLGPLGGLVADRYDKRRVLYATQASAGLLALTLGLLAATGSVQLWQVYVLAAGLGFVNLFDNPARQTFVFELVGPELLPNAISLNSVLINGARVIGPAIGGILIVTVGVATCFMVNAGSYLAVLVALALMDASRLNRRQGVVRAKGQIREGLRYAWATRELRDSLLAMAVVGVFAFNFTVTLPLLAKFTFHGGAGLASVFMAAMGAGAVVGGLFTAFRSRPSTRLLAFIGLVFGASILAVAVSPSALVATATLVVMGAAAISFVATNNATLQLRADPAMRGRVMSLNAIAFLGSTPIGAPLLGAISDVASPRAAFALGGVATLLASVPLFALSRHQGRQREEAAVLVQSELGEPGTHQPQPRGAVRPA